MSLLLDNKGRERLPRPSSAWSSHLHLLPFAAILSLIILHLSNHFTFPNPFPQPDKPTSTLDIKNFKESVLKCQRLNLLPGPPADFHNRKASDRFVEGTPPTLITNATVWTGLNDGFEVLKGVDILLDRGLIISIGKGLASTKYSKNTVTLDAQGAWLTPGIFDIHSHLGVDSLPNLSGSGDTNSVQAPILPFLRSLDGINTHDLAYHRSISGGVTSSLILPGSANNIGGQAFVIKLRDTKEKTPDSMVLEMPWNVPGVGFRKGEEWKDGDPPRWRHMKMACGENIRRVYKQTRLDLSWNFRSSLDKAKAIKIKQDEFCESALTAHAAGKVLSGESAKFPEELQWEALVDVLRGKVKVNTHCYETTDLAAFIRHTNEYKFPLAAFHHAHEAWMVPDLLKSAWNSTPAVAIFATNARYKREAWRGTEYAAKILNEANITVLMKSDHPVLDSRFLLFEAQQAHHFGLPENLAIASITSKTATTAGFGHRAGFIKPNYDADVVLWDSHPLTLGATPLQVFIDGIAQLKRPYPAKERDTATAITPMIASVPLRPETLREEEDDWEMDDSVKTLDEVVFTNVTEVLLRSKEGTSLHSYGADQVAPFEVRINSGKVVCLGQCGALNTTSSVIDLKGGSLLPPLVAFGPALGLLDIISEKSTQDNPVYDPLFSGDLSRTQQLWGPRVAVRAIDGIAFGGKHLRVAKEAGVGKAVTAPTGDGFFRGVSVAFRTDAKNVLDKGAIIKDVVALHVTIGHYKALQMPSISTEIAELRGLLFGEMGSDSSSFKDYPSPDYFSMAANGEIPLVINAWKADVIATLILLKKEVEEVAKPASPLKWIIHGGQEAHLVANEIAEAGISIILSPPRAIPESWDERRATPGPPLTKRNAANVLHNAGVHLALGVPEEWQARTLLWEAAWAARDSNAEVSRSDALAWLSTNLEAMLDISPVSDAVEFVAYERDPFEFGSRPVAASNPYRQIELM